MNNDMTMCDKGCEKKERCARWTTPWKNFMQSVSDFKPDIYGKCDFFWDNETRFGELP